MKKGLFLLPLLAAFALCGCGDNGGGGSGGGGGGSGGGGGEGGDDQFVIDFNEVDKEVFPYVSDSSAFTFEYQDMEFNCMGCYLSNDRDTGDNYLMMKNKWGDKDNPTYSQEGEYAFFGNATAFDSPIKSVEVTINGSSSSASTVYRVNILDSAAEEAVTSGGKTGKKGQTVTVSGDGKYFAVSTNAASGKIYNGQVLKVVVSF